MRGERRDAWEGLGTVLGALILITCATGLVRADSPPIRLSVEISWRPNEGSIGHAQTVPGSGTAIELSSGRVLDVVEWPDSGAGDVPQGSRVVRPEPNGSASLPLGTGQSGRARARLEAPIEASLTIRTPIEVFTLPLIALLDGEQQSPPESGGTIRVRRLPWDALEVQVAGEGVVSPGTIVPVNVGVNVLTPEPTEVSLHLSARLKPIRSDRIVWEDSRRLVVPTNATPPSAQLLNLPMPSEEGTYVLELAASWAPRDPQVDGTRLGRWWRRLRNRSTDVSVRNVSFAVLSSAPGSPMTKLPDVPRRIGPDRVDLVVDSTELGRPRGLRPRAEGQLPTVNARLDAPWTIPEELLVDPLRRERIWSILGRVGFDYRALAPAGPEGLSWTALPLKVPHPDRPHRLDLSVLGGDPSALSVALVAPGDRPRMLLDARGYGPPLIGIGLQTNLSWPVWPDTSDPVLIVVNRSADRPLWLGEVKLVELADQAPPLPLVGPPADGGRSLALRMTEPGALQRFGGTSDNGPDDPVARGQHLAAYLASVGASGVVLPPPFADRLVRGAQGGQAHEDPIGPDRNAVLLAILKRQGFSVIVELDLEGVTLSGLPAPDDPKAEALGLVRLDRSGASGADRPTYNVLRPEVQRAMTRQVLAAVGKPGSGQGPGIDGVLIKLGPGPTLPGRPDTGLDDETYARFVRDAIKGEVAPGLKREDPDRFAARHQYVTGPALVPWLTWRSRQVGSYYTGLAASIAEAAPGVSLMIATPGLDDGPVGAEARRFDRDGLPPDSAWRSLGLDLADWPRKDGPLPYLLRGVGTGVGDLEHDLATHPALDAQLLARPRRGVLIGLNQGEGHASDEADPDRALRLSALPQPDGVEGEELFAHALASLDAGWVVVSSSTITGREERLRRFARIFRGLPKPVGGSAGSASGGSVVRLLNSGDRSYVSFSNDTPYALRLTAVVAAPSPVSIEDIGRGLPLPTEVVPGGHRIMIDLPPFGLSALRVGASGVRLASVVAAYDPQREAHRSAVARRLQSLASGSSINHLNPGFEPESLVRQASSDGAVDEEIPGWATEGSDGASLAIDLKKPRTGRGSLRLSAPEAPATAASPAFLAPGPAATLRGFVRTDPPDASVRIRIESEPGVSEAVHLAADLPGQDRSDWTPLALRAPGLPTDGVSMLRLRFELRSPGRLWVDDLSLTGPGLTQARSCLTAALQAYDEGRFADFARLARSHWVLEAGGPIVPVPQPPVVAPLAGEVPTDLPARSRLR